MLFIECNSLSAIQNVGAHEKAGRNCHRRLLLRIYTHCSLSLCAVLQLNQAYGQYIKFNSLFSVSLIPTAQMCVYVPKNRFKHQSVSVTGHVFITNGYWEKKHSHLLLSNTFDFQLGAIFFGLISTGAVDASYCFMCRIKLIYCILQSAGGEGGGRRSTNKFK